MKRALVAVAACGIGALLGVTARADQAPHVANWSAPPYWTAPAAERDGVRESASYGTLSTEALPSAPLPFIAITPCRLADTRAGTGFTGPFGPPRLVASTPRAFPVGGYCGIPTTARAVSANVTVVVPSAAGFLSFYPSLTTWGGVSNINFAAGAVIANTAIVPLGTDAGMNVYGNAATDLIIDVNGYYAPTVGGTGNTAVGDGALQSLSTGASNTAVGYAAMDALTTATDNVAVGARSLGAITDSKENVAVGAGALGVATLGPNTAVGFEALAADGSGSGNTAVGHQALTANVDGTNNVALGDGALSALTAGSWNIAIGKDAGTGKTTGNNNIYIGAPGTQLDASVIRIGASQSSAYIAGINGSGVTGQAVYVDSNGKLGVVTSSRRYKKDIEEIGDAAAILEQLRPVMFRYVADASGERQFGLIAEEVAQVAPELVVFDKAGRPETVKYHLVNALLLAEVQRLEARLKAVEQALEEMRKAAPAR